jgi:hypothetical protein
MSRVRQFDKHLRREPREHMGSRLQAYSGEGVLEIELTAWDLLALSQPRAIANSAAPCADSTPAIARFLTSHVGRSLGAATIVAAVAGLIVYLAIPSEQPAPTATDRSNLPPGLISVLSISASAPLPVRFINPFDATEVFEFPPGTSEADARDRVAELLIERAQDRQRTFRR